jgi:3-dehydroquinate synthase
MILNFGHTVGHGLEGATAYRKFLHGEAVGWGIIAAARLSEEMKFLKTETAQRIEKLVRSVGPLPAWPKQPAARLLEAMRTDKKAQRGKLRFVLAEGIGRVRVVDDVPEALVLRVLAALGGASRESKGTK